MLNKGDKPFHPEISTDTSNQLFENMTIFTGSDIRSRIKKTVNRYEPRVIIEQVKVETNMDRNEINILVRMSFKNISSPPVVLPLTLKRLR